ncbi:MAG: hypothetical protein SCARUB_03246 [Candidatus Scalindua rubra]|uniref:Antitoxin VapB11 n=1 Tax=Candidatus Scalindua rubra TaxID=1872076 RepID=A0A1E3X7N8_9BACT|nr:MAG: hypothetical protein SCARUB_03246 [Candidatus Scalindua rubra]
MEVFQLLFKYKLVIICFYVYSIYKIYTYDRRLQMRTNVVIDDKLMETALKLSGLRTKRDTIEAGLKLLVEFYMIIGISTH